MQMNRGNLRTGDAREDVVYGPEVDVVQSVGGDTLGRQCRRHVDRFRTLAPRRNVEIARWIEAAQVPSALATDRGVKTDDRKSAAALLSRPFDEAREPVLACEFVGPPLMHNLAADRD